MFDTIIRTNFIDPETLNYLINYLNRSDFYINESYGNLENIESLDKIDGVTDEKIAELGLSPIPNEVLRSHRFIDSSDEIQIIMFKITKMCEQLIADKYGNTVTNMQGGDFIRYKTGQSLPYHKDWTLSDWVKKNDLPEVHLSSVFYLNDNYEGGELCFSSRKFDDYSCDIMSLKPEAGTIIFFDALRWHASLPVLKGEKYAVTNFYTLA